MGSVEKAKEFLNFTWVEPSQPFKDALEIIHSLIAKIERLEMHHLETEAEENAKIVIQEWDKEHQLVQIIRAMLEERK